MDTESETPIKQFAYTWAQGTFWLGAMFIGGSAALIGYFAFMTLPLHVGMVIEHGLTVSQLLQQPLGKYGTLRWHWFVIWAVWVIISTAGVISAVEVFDDD